MARIKIRVSAGVFEVSLIRVIEETKSIEVLWDRGIKREFKWGSVVFGSTDGPVQQKPSELAPEVAGTSHRLSSWLITEFLCIQPRLALHRLTHTAQPLCQ